MAKYGRPVLLAFPHQVLQVTSVCKTSDRSNKLTVMLVLGLGLGLESVGRGLDAVMLYTFILSSWSLGMEFVPLGYLREFRLFLVA